MVRRQEQVDANGITHWVVSVSSGDHTTAVSKEAATVTICPHAALTLECVVAGWNLSRMERICRQLVADRDQAQGHLR